MKNQNMKLNFYKIWEKLKKIQFLAVFLLGLIDIFSYKILYIVIFIDGFGDKTLII